MGTILVTGGTGFIGKNLINRLTEAGHQVRTLIRPSENSPDLPKGVPVQAVVAGFNDVRGLRAAMVGVDTIYHLAGAEWHGAYASLMAVDIEGTRTIVDVAAEAGVNRIFYVSHLGADRASAYPVMKAKAIAEEHVRRSGLDYTIFRSAIVFGPDDGFTTGLGFILKFFPFIFMLPGDGKTMLQPIWIEDLIACLTWSLEDQKTRNQIFEVGGSEYLSIQQIVEIMIETMGLRRLILHLGIPYLRGLTVMLESIFPQIPISVYWLDYLASNRTCAIDTLPRIFHLIPARFSVNTLDYLNDVNWRQILWRSLSSRQRIRRRSRTSPA
jgi:NADH dehydrogenase